MRTVLLDTDIGLDIDDALCLAYLLAQPACDLVGVTTVSGEPEQRARIAATLCAVTPRTTIVSLDVTQRLVLSSAALRRRTTTPLLHLVLALADATDDHITFHDPLAAAMLFDDDPCRFEAGTASIVLAEGDRRGLSHWQPVPGPHRASVSGAVDVDGFSRHYLAVVERDHQS